MKHPGTLKLHWYAVFSVLFLLSAYGILLLDKNTVIQLTREDSLVEYVGALSFLCAGSIFLALYLRSNRGNDLLFFSTRKNIFFLLLAIVLLFAAGEELSWGQRLFGFETPKILQGVNLQGEFNLHNLVPFHPRDQTGQYKSKLARMFTLERLFAIFWLLYCVVVPALVSLLDSARGFVTRINLPVVPLTLGIFFPISHILAKSLELFLVKESTPLHWPMIEIKETTTSVLFLLVAIYFLQAKTRKTKTPESAVVS